MTCWHNQLDSVKVEKNEYDILWLSVLICFNLNMHSIKSNCHLLFQAILRYTYETFSLPSKLFSYFIFWIIELPYDCKLLNIYPVLEHNIKFLEIIWNGVSYPTSLTGPHWLFLPHELCKMSLLKEVCNLFFSTATPIKLKRGWINLDCI